jgi:KUP system potassium uptake protein
MSEPAGSGASSSEVIPAGHADLSADEEAGPPPETGIAGLSLAALGVVFGDIGTSPVYTFRERSNPEHGLGLSPENVLGALSLIVWAPIMAVASEHVLPIIRGDNRGGGAILALLALVQQAARAH